MAQYICVRKNAYHDSVSLMTLTNELKKSDEIEDAVVSMATDMNKELAENIGFISDDIQSAGPNDLLIALRCPDEEACERMVVRVDELLQSKKKKAAKSKEATYRSIHQANDDDADLNMAVISVAGDYAAREVNAALDCGMNVMLFSVNVSVEDEVAFKNKAHELGLLVMGPDCGTAIIDGVGLCFANDVRRGSIGIVAASGTGLQEVSVIIDRLGGGISQAIGTGGRDLSAPVGGMMMLDGISKLEDDEDTSVIVLVSKPPVPEVAEKVLHAVEQCTKPVVVCFIADEAHRGGDGIVFARSLEDAAIQAVALSKGEDAPSSGKSVYPVAEEARRFAGKLSANQKSIRALYCGGTLAAEALFEMSKVRDGVVSNVAKKAHQKMSDPFVSTGDTIVDLGDDVFTKGRPHPMIDPSIRCDRIVAEAMDESVGVILLDFELGFGSNADPVGATIEAIEQAQKIAGEQGRHMAFVGYVLGTDRDYQDYQKQCAMLEEAGVLIAQSNLNAVETALAIVGA